MPYLETIKYLESFINYERIPVWSYKESLKLERIADFLEIIGNPQDSLKCVHIAGTKGKGSTCAFIAYILKEAGYKVGLYASPHLSDFRERIRILCSLPTGEAGKLQASGPGLSGDFEGMISKGELSALVGKLKPDVEEYNKNSKYGPLSFFEVYTSMAFVYFKENEVDFAVLETGLGGRLDATNAADSLVCAITPLSYEHTQKLGNTLKEIASEKSGIIKTSGQIVISAPQEPEAMVVIRKRCREVKARLYEFGRDIIYKKTIYGFEVKIRAEKYTDLMIQLIGKHQLVNAAIAIGVVEALRAYKVKVDVDTIRKGLYNTAWPGRCEVVSRMPYVILDGAQNIASARALKKTIKKYFRYKKLILVLGVSKDKDIKGICTELYDLADVVILTRANNPRAAEPQVLNEGFEGKESYILNSIKEAKNKAIQLAKKEDLILVCGSLFVVGEFRVNFQQKRRIHG
ncbi:MAG: folylpolyglutamate synthase/dihydrofolate synthase family protein [Candidatus Omnitrophota bacterium]